MSDQENNLQKRIKCPKGMQLPKSVKCLAAMGNFANKAERNAFMRSTGIAIHHAANRSKYAPKMDGIDSPDRKA